MTRPGTHFVVIRRNWRFVGRGGAYVLLPGEVRESSFATEAEAQDDARRREADARAKVNPFRCGTTWADRSHLPEAVFSDFLRDAGVEPPAAAPDEPIDWAAWWDEKAKHLGDAQRQRVWEGLDRVRFFQVSERPVRPVLYAVVRIEWNYNDQWYYPSAEGGTVQVAYRSRERAEQERGRLEAEARQHWRSQLDLPSLDDLASARGDGGELFPFDMEVRRFLGDDPFGPRRTPPRRMRPVDPDDFDDYDEDDEEDEGGERQQRERPQEVEIEGGEFAVEEVPFYEVIELEEAG